MFLFGGSYASGEQNQKFYSLAIDKVSWAVIKNVSDIDVIFHNNLEYRKGCTSQSQETSILLVFMETICLSSEDLRMESERIPSLDLNSIQTLGFK
jgi:hypothetical protein